MLNQFMDRPLDPPNRQRIETEGQQPPGALNLDGQGITTLSETLPVALNIGLKLLALIAHAHPLRIRRELRRSLSSIDAGVEAMMVLQ
jgi:hypothetical protein